MSPAALSLRHLRRAGFLAETVEKWIAQAGVRRDLFGIIDILAITPDEPILAVQTTSIGNMSARISKARSCPGLGVWLSTGHARFEVHGWDLVCGQWHPKIVELRGPDLAADVLIRPPRRGRRHAEPGDLFVGMVDE